MQQRRLAISLFLLTACLFFSRGVIADNDEVQAPIAKVSIFESGEIFLNGEPTSLEALDKAFETLEAQKGGVWYYRENSAADPPPQAMSVIRLVMKHGLPISLSVKPDFSDYVDVYGLSHPRNGQLSL